MVVGNDNIAKSQVIDDGCNAVVEVVGTVALVHRDAMNDSISAVLEEAPDSVTLLHMLPHLGSLFVPIHGLVIDDHDMRLPLEDLEGS